MSKEPGQLAFEAYRSRVKTLATMPWAACAEGRKADWAAVESAIRADERALLQAEFDRLREALRAIAGARPRCCEISDAMQYIARAALSDSPAALAKEPQG